MKVGWGEGFVIWHNNDIDQLNMKDKTTEWGKGMDAQLQKKFDLLIKQDLNSLKNAKTQEEKREASENIEALKSVYNAYTFSEKAMKALS